MVLMVSDFFFAGVREPSILGKKERKKNRSCMDSIGTEQQLCHNTGLGPLQPRTLDVNMVYLEVYLSGSGLRIRENLTIMHMALQQTYHRQTFHRQTLQQKHVSIHSIHGISSGSVSGVILLEAIRRGRDEGGSFLQTSSRDMLTIMKQCKPVFVILRHIFQYVYTHTSPDIHRYCNDVLHVYYMRFGRDGNEQVVKTKWDTKEDLFLTLRRSSSIPFITSWPMMDSDYYYYDGIGFIGTIRPRPNHVMLVSLSYVPGILVNTFLYVPSADFGIPLRFGGSLKPGTVYLSSGTFEHCTYIHQFSSSIRRFLYLTTVLARLFPRRLFFLLSGMAMLRYLSMWSRRYRLGILASNIVRYLVGY